VAPQVWEPPVPQAWVAPGAHAPWLAQALQSDQTPFVHERVWLPQLPQVWVVGPVQLWPPQGSHWQVAPQVCIPPVPQVRIEPGAHAPSPAHADQPDQTPLLHVRVWVPQAPQPWVVGPRQVCPAQGDHWQKPVQLWVPLMPQTWVAPGVHPIAVQVPTLPLTVQLSQNPPQARSQQTPPAHERPP
jgi:hypothetical protein